MMATEYKKPLPVPENPEPSRPFWEAAKRHELVMPRCKRCNDLFWYPREQCPNCFSQEIDWVTVSGKGKVYAFTIVYQAAHPEYQKEAPYVFAAIDLLEGTRIISNVIGIPPDQVKVDMSVEAVFEDVTPEWTLVKFKPAK
ncbi:MAG: Zn-ribbon domain-containing OB-fold protein [Chloroflexi bacterium]|nr:Zn-ribbon domain-containing OB-fold protein [Chloroflexota bacterium]